MGVSIACVITVLNLIQRYLEYRSGFEMDFKNRSKEQPENLANDDQLRFKKWQTEKQYLYVFGNLLSQGSEPPTIPRRHMSQVFCFWLGGLCPSKRLPYRLVAGVWTLAAFFFVQSYTSTLFTYVVTPVNHPLINSIYDVLESKDINLIIRETGFINTLLVASGKR